MSLFSKEFDISRGTTQDVDLIRDFTRAAYAKWIPLIGREPLPMSADYETALREHRFDLLYKDCLLYTSPSPRDGLLSRMPSSA